MRRCLAAAAAGTAAATVSCAPDADVDTLPATFQVACTEEMPCDGDLRIDSLEKSDSCRYGARGAGSGFDAPGDGEIYLEALGEVTAHSTEHPDGVLLDELEYVDADGETRQARYVTDCREADDGRVFWTKNVAEGRTWELYQTWIVPEDTETVIVEKRTVSLPAVSAVS